MNECHFFFCRPSSITGFKRGSRSISGTVRQREEVGGSMYHSGGHEEEGTQARSDGAAWGGGRGDEGESKRGGRCRLQRDMTPSVHFCNRSIACCSLCWLFGARFRSGEGSCHRCVSSAREGEDNEKRKQDRCYCYRTHAPCSVFFSFFASFSLF